MVVAVVVDAQYHHHMRMQCETVVKHLKETSGGRNTVARMEVSFKVDSASRYVTVLTVRVVSEPVGSPSRAHCCSPDGRINLRADL